VPRVTGIVETALYVDDLPRASRFYVELFGFPVMVQDARIVALDVGPGSVLLLFKRGASREAQPTPAGYVPPHDGSGPLHFAFAIPAADLEAWESRLAENGIAIEGRAHWPRGGTSLYFRDPDQHLVELATPGIWTNY
jgi:catechol 2,3-dioxygenase-like lactoylglutathione lyase family enzyme